ncbi:MAG: tetratricopeptide repeat protein [Candidatus Bipolaricaulia bacterium]
MRQFFDKYRKVIVWIMILSFFFGSAVFAAFRFINPSRSPATSKTTKKTAIVVEGEKITKEEFDRAYQQALYRQKQIYKRFGRNFESVLRGASGKLEKLKMKVRVAESLIKDKIIEKESEKRNIKISDRSVTQQFNNQIDKILKKNNWNKEDLRKAVKDQGSTYPRFKRRLKGRIRESLKLAELKSQVTKGIKPTKDELKTYYQNHLSHYVQTPAKVLASHIVTDTQTEAKSIANRVKKGKASFDVLADKLMENPEIGWIKKGERGDKIAKTAFTLKEGEVSEPFRAEEGWAVIKTLKKKEPQAPPLSKINGKVRSDYLNSKRDEAFNEWYKKQRAEAEIEIKLPLVEAQLKSQNDIDKGLKLFKDLRSRQESVDPYISYFIGRLYEKKLKKVTEENQKSGISRDEKARSRRKTETYRQKAVENYLKVVRKEDAKDEQLLRRIVNLDGDNPEANYYLAELASEKKRYNQAISRYKKAIEERPDYIAAYLGYGDLLRKMGNYDGAIKQYKKALEIDSKVTRARLKLANTYMDNGNYELAEEEFNRVLDTHSENFKALEGLGDLFKERKQFKKAISYYRSALEQRPSVSARLDLAEVYLEKGDLEEAKSQFNEVIINHPYEARAYLGLGKVYEKENAKQKALTQYREGLSRATDEKVKISIAKNIVRLKPDSLDTRFLLASIYSDRHMYDSAIDQYEKILGFSPTKSQLGEVYKGLAKAYFSKTDYRKAKKYYQKGLEFAKKRAKRASLYKGIVKSEMEITEKGKLSETGLEALYQLAKIRYEQGSSKKAKDLISRIQEQDKSFKSEEIAKLLRKINRDKNATGKVSGD